MEYFHGPRPRTLSPRILGAFFFNDRLSVSRGCLSLFARVILAPLVTAFLLTFILTPFVRFLQSKGLGRLPAVFLVAGMVFSLVFGFFATMINQFNGLAGELPQYKTQIIGKIDSVRAWGSGTVPDSFLDLLKDVSKSLVHDPSIVQTDGEAPVPVKLESSSTPFYQSVMGSTLDIAINIGMVMLLVFFMLIKRENLRNRLVRLIGTGHLSKTINALDDSSTRISNYLLMQLLVNVSFGLIVGVGLFFIGIPYAFVWGFFGTLLRYIPYLGPILAASFPLMLAWAVFPDWLQLILVGGLFFLLELICSNFLEPYLYGRSIGVSEVALLTMVVFWGWLWGPIGLVLATPLTATLVVFGRHFSQLKVLDILLGDEAPLEPPTAFYQRLLANDPREATEIVVKYLKEHPIENVYEELFVPALANLRREKRRGLLPPEEITVILQMTRDILVKAVYPLQDADWAKNLNQGESPDPAVRFLVFGMATGDEDQIILEMFKEALNPEKFQFKVLSSEMLLSEMLQQIEEDKPGCVLMGISRRSARQRGILKKIRNEHPDLAICLAIWGSTTLADVVIKRWHRAGANQIGTSFKDIANRLNEMRQVRPKQKITQ